MNGFLKTISKLTMFMGLSDDDLGGADAKVSIAIKDLDRCAWCNTQQMATPFISFLDKGLTIYNQESKQNIIQYIKNNHIRDS